MSSSTVVELENSGYQLCIPTGQSFKCRMLRVKDGVFDYVDVYASLKDLISAASSLPVEQQKLLELVN